MSNPGTQLGQRFFLEPRVGAQPKRRTPARMRQDENVRQEIAPACDRRSHRSRSGAGEVVVDRAAADEQGQLDRWEERAHLRMPARSAFVYTFENIASNTRTVMSTANTPSENMLSRSGVALRSTVPPSFRAKVGRFAGQGICVNRRVGIWAEVAYRAQNLSDRSHPGAHRRGKVNF